MFEQLDLYPGLRKALDDLQLDTATPVQEAAVPAALDGRDLLVCAPTGTGKTFAFLIPVIQQLAASSLPGHPGTLALLLAPTRELARQLFKQAETLTASTPLNVLLLTGGEPFKVQIAELRKAPEIVVATPGRLLELMERQAVDLSALRHLVLDEADRVLEMGFGQDVEAVAAAASDQRQTLMFSATLGRSGLDALGRTLLRDPLTINLGNQAPEALSHQILLTDDRDHKNRALTWLLRQHDFERALVFSNTREDSERLYTLLRAQNLPVGVLHGEKSHEARKDIMNRFRQGNLRILVASDVAARGLDIPEVELVINMDLPRRGDDYTHRAGRTGRMARAGTAISLVGPGDWNTMISIQRYLKINFEQLDIAELRGRFKGPKNVKSSGKTVGRKKRKPATTKASAKPAARRKKAATKRKAGAPLTGNETLKRRK